MSRKSLQLAFGIGALLCSLPSFAGTLADSPLFLQSPVPPNVLFSLSVEYPTANTAAYQGSNDYSANETYLGIFDPAKCYSYSGSGATAWFSPTAAATNHVCSGSWSGNFLNWASMTGLDEFRYAMTGGNRYQDTASLTVLERAYQSGQGGTSNFTNKTYTGTGATPYPSTANLTIANQGQGTQMQVTLGGTGTAQCANPQRSGSAFTCDLTMQNTNETGSCTSWTGTGTNASPYTCSTFGAFAGAGTPTGSTPGTKSAATTTSTDTVTCSNPSGTSSSNFSCTLTDTQGNTGSCTTWTGNGTSASPFSCSNFGTFGSATFTASSQATATSYSTPSTIQKTAIVSESSCSIQQSSPWTITCPLQSTPARTISCIPSSGDGSSGNPYRCTSSSSWTIDGTPTATYVSNTNSATVRRAPSSGSLPRPRYYPPATVTYNEAQASATYWYIPSYTGSDATAAYYYYSTYNLTFGGTTKYYVRAEVCQPSPVSGTAREDNCVKYGTSSYKPVGEVQRNGEKMRFGVLSYYNANDIDNAVMRSKLKYVAPLKWSSSGGSVANTNAEWSATDGTLPANPDPSEASASYPSAVSKSGVINYINQFGTVSQGYKTYDNVGKLYYESLRYLRGLQPTTAFYTRATAAGADGFPIIRSWDDPVQYWCQKNYVIAMGDTHTHCDKRLPGGTSTSYGASQCAAQNSQAADQGSFSDSGVNVATLTNALGTLEGRSNLANTFGFAGSASYYMSGLAYGAAKDGFRNMSATINGVTSSVPVKAKTYVIDVQEYGDKGAPSSTSPGSQYWLAAKYGGVDTFDTSGNPQNWSRTIPGYTGAWPNTLLPAGNPADMIAAVKGALSSIAAQTGAGAGVGVSTGDLRTGNGTNLYSATFNSSDWSGDVKSYRLNSDLTINTTPSWSASAFLNPTRLNTSGAGNWSARRVLTFNDGLLANGTADTSASGRQGSLFTTTDSSGTVEFTTDLSARQQDLLDRDPGSNLIDGRGPYRVRYLLGDNSNEGASGFNWRTRTGSLGDFVNSSPVYVRYPSAKNVPPADYADYKIYATAIASRTPILYVGGNDGMLHAFDASDAADDGTSAAAATTNSGKEVLAYIPSSVYPKLNQLSWPNYAHKYFVDGTPVVADAQLSTPNCTASSDSTKCWRTIVTGGLNGGGQGIYALNATAPSTFASGTPKSLVFWEFTDRDDADLGNTYVQPLVRKMNNGKWAVIFGNGFNNTDSDGSVSTTGHAYLYILYVDGPGFDSSGRGKPWTLGTDYRKIELIAPNAGTTPLSPANGLTTVFGVDKNDDNVVDYLYAGDRYGNLWKVDVSDTNPANWGSAFSSSGVPLPLFTAKTDETTPKKQQITTSPTAALHPGGGFLVMFGTGSFVDDSDNQGPFSTNSFYGIWDKDDGTRVTSRSQLQKQASLAKFTTSGGITYGLQSDCIPQYSATTLPVQGAATTTCPATLAPVAVGNPVPQQLGWVLDLHNDPAITDSGERYISSVLPILESGLLSFVTLTPNGDVCGGNGYDWTYNLDYLTGASYSKPVFYTAGSPTSPVSVTFTIPGTTTTVTKYPSGQKLGTALGQNPKRIYYETDVGSGDPSADSSCSPFVKGRPCKKVKRACDIVTVAGGCTSVTPPATGRVSWRHIMQ